MPDAWHRIFLCPSGSGVSGFVHFRRYRYRYRYRWRYQRSSSGLMSKPLEASLTIR